MEQQPTRANTLRAKIAACISLLWMEEDFFPAPQHATAQHREHVQPTDITAENQPQ